VSFHTYRPFLSDSHSKIFERSINPDHPIRLENIKIIDSDSELDLRPGEFIFRTKRGLPHQSQSPDEMYEAIPTSQFSSDD